MKRIIKACGHQNVLGTHQTTLEITKERELGLKGDCIIGVGATLACADLPEDLKKELKSKKKFKITLEVGDLAEEIAGFGSNDLILTNAQDIVIRKSDYIDDRTLLINCDKACADLSREFVEKLKDKNQELIFSIMSSY